MQYIMIASVLAAPALNHLEATNAYANPSPSVIPATINAYGKPSESPSPTVSDQHSYPTQSGDSELAQETTAAVLDDHTYPIVEPTQAPIPKSEPEPKESQVEPITEPTPECTESTTPSEAPVEASPTQNGYGDTFQSSASQHFISVAVVGALFFQ